MSWAYAGKAALIDLSSRSVTVIPITDDLKTQYIGGRGFIAHWLFEKVPAEVDALSPDNLLIFANGMFTGTLAPSSARISIGAKAPETGLWSIGNAGGFFGVELKRAGWDAIIIKGAARERTYIRILNSQITFHNADHLWGLDTHQTDDAIHNENPNLNLYVSCIGQAGEAGVLLSTIIFEKVRSAGRGGLGAVMGSKNLKAVAVHGDGSIPIFEPESYYQECKEIIDRSAKLYLSKRWLKGSYGKVRGLSEVGALSTRNYQQTSFNEIGSIDAETYVRSFKQRRMRACFACPIPCWSSFYVSDGKFKGLHGENANATTFKEMGARCGLDKMDAILKATTMLNRYGLDTISTPGVIGFALECYQRGIITRKTTEGIALEWGNEDAIINLITQIAHRAGIGEQLSQGVKRCAEFWGDESKYYALEVKGLETVGTDPRGQPSWGLAYATSTRGACHMRAYTHFEDHGMKEEDMVRVAGTARIADRFDTVGKGRGVAYVENLRALGDALGVCHLLTSAELGFPEVWAPLFESASGISLSPESLFLVGERIYNIERIANLRAGVTPADDTLPARFLEEPVPDGPAKGKVCPLQPMLEEYYAARDWDPISGYPSRKKLAELGLLEIKEIFK